MGPSRQTRNKWIHCNIFIVSIISCNVFFRLALDFFIFFARLVEHVHYIQYDLQCVALLCIFNAKMLTLEKHKSLKDETSGISWSSMETVFLTETITLSESTL